MTPLKKSYTTSTSEAEVNHDQSYTSFQKSNIQTQKRIILENSDLVTDISNRVTSLCSEGSSLTDLREQSLTLTSRTVMFSSVLHKYRKADDLHENSDHLITAIVKEMMTRVPLLLDSMLCVAEPNNNIVPASIIPSLATCYSILLKLRYNNLSVFHRMVSAITLKGGLNDRGQARLNYLGMTLSCERRLQFQESISLSSENLIIDKLKFNPLIKITGDNLDVYIKASQLFTDKRNKDLHMFVSNVIFSRIASMDMSIESPNVDVNSIQAADIYQQEQLLDVYGVLKGLQGKTTLFGRLVLYDYYIRLDNLL
ncbi:uncharacterized protein LOC126816910 [Patella vulgata]|uniref:uncharacterized protein LOC126816910 n=1 Tax=Patella vulgata TaxID=6465 RepID=UPI00217F6791|nr:uncharacterized protein LOC126816910 [Patella vulgata]